jgi:hypothetical protein
MSVQTITDELLGEIEAAANDVRGWTIREYFQEPEEGFLPADWEWYVGTIDEDGNRYPLLNVNAHQYDSDDSEKLAMYYALANRDSVLAMAAELRTLRVENAAHVSFIAKQVATIRELRKDLDDTNSMLIDTAKSRMALQGHVNNIKSESLIWERAIQETAIEKDLIRSENKRMSKDSSRLDWLMHNLGGYALTTIGVITSGNCSREEIDTAMEQAK